MGSRKLTRRQFAGAMAVTAVAPTLLAAHENKPATQEAKPGEPSGDDESQAMKRIREFAVPDGAEPAFAFKA